MSNVTLLLVSLFAAAAASCSYDETPVAWTQMTCVGAGRMYRCVTDDQERTYRCAEVRPVAAAVTPEKAP
jgi:hypothetical protein